MGDPNDSTQVMPPVGKRTRGQAAMATLAQRLKDIKHAQVRFTASVLIGTALWWVVLFAATRDFQKTNFVFTNTFQYLAVAWACWFMYPYFMRVEAKQDAAIAMGHDSVDLMAKVDDAIEARAAKFDKLVARLDKLAAEIDAGTHPLAKQFAAIKEDMAAIRVRVEKGNEPLPVNRRPAATATGAIGGDTPAAGGVGVGGDGHAR